MNRESNMTKKFTPIKAGMTLCTTRSGAESHIAQQPIAEAKYFCEDILMSRLVSVFGRIRAADGRPSPPQILTAIDNELNEI